MRTYNCTCTHYGTQVILSIYLIINQQTREQSKMVWCVILIAVLKLVELITKGISYT